MDFVCVCVRIPKCGSTSLANILKSFFADRCVFHLPHTLDIEGDLSPLQRLRFCRSQIRNLLARYRTTNIVDAYQYIGQRALDGDLILGGHIDFVSVRRNIARPVKMITLFRDPVARCRSEYNYCRQAYFAKPVISRFDMSIKHKTAGRFSFCGYLDFLCEHPETYGDLAARYIGWDGQQNLNEFFACHVFHSGVLEDNAGFASGLARKMGKPSHFPHDNKSKVSAATIEAVERRKIEQLYPRDFQLYQWQLAQSGKERTRLGDVAPLIAAAGR